jgi:hypothetical protein
MSQVSFSFLSALLIIFYNYSVQIHCKSHSDDECPPAPIQHQDDRGWRCSVSGFRYAFFCSTNLFLPLDYVYVRKRTTRLPPTITPWTVGRRLGTSNSNHLNVSNHHKNNNDTHHHCQDTQSPHDDDRGSRCRCVSSPGMFLTFFLL